MAKVNDILNHLTNSSPYFIPPLDQKINLYEYSTKLFEKAITFETWHNTNLIALIACYFNESKAFITNVSCEKEYTGKGIAGKLLKDCIAYSKNKKITTIELEVNSKNNNAIHLYTKFGFTIFETKDETILMKLNIN